VSTPRACTFTDQVTDGRGRALDFSRGRRLVNNDGVIATNGVLHSAVVDAVTKALGPSSL
jgi:3'(2'), 5'-bisphosphate nucleotidase